MKGRSLGDIRLEAELGILPPSQQALAEKAFANLEAKEAAIEKLLTALGETGTIREACEISGIPRWSLEGWKKQDPVLSERLEMAHAQYTDKLEKEAYRRGLEKSDLLLIFTLKKRNHAFRDNYKVEHTGEVTVRLVNYADQKAVIDADIVKAATSVTPEIPVEPEPPGKPVEPAK